MRNRKEIPPALIRAYIAEEISTTEIARATGMSGATICRRLREAGVTIRKQGTRMDKVRETDAIAEAVLTDGESVRSVAYRLGISTQTVYYRLQTWANR